MAKENKKEKENENGYIYQMLKIMDDFFDEKKTDFEIMADFLS